MTDQRPPEGSFLKADGEYYKVVEYRDEHGEVDIAHVSRAGLMPVSTGHLRENTHHANGEVWRYTGDQL